MITIISGTNRTGSFTEKLSEYYYKLIQESSSEQVMLLNLGDLPLDYYVNEMYSEEAQVSALSEIQDTYIVPASKFIFIVPEYNGGIPGILKLFIDAISIRKYEDSFFGKKACLTGVSSGRAGNLRGMEHLSGILNYLKVIVYPDRLPVSSIEEVFDNSDSIRDQETMLVIKEQVHGFLHF